MFPEVCSGSKSPATYLTYLSLHVPGRGTCRYSPAQLCQLCPRMVLSAMTITVAWSYLRLERHLGGQDKERYWDSLIWGNWIGGSFDRSSSKGVFQKRILLRSTYSWSDQENYKLICNIQSNSNWKYWKAMTTRSDAHGNPPRNCWLWYMMYFDASPFSGGIGGREKIKLSLDRSKKSMLIMLIMAGHAVHGGHICLTWRIFCLSVWHEIHEWDA